MSYSFKREAQTEFNSTGQELGTLKGHTAEVIALHYNNDGNQIISGSFDGTVNIWDTRTFTCVLDSLSYLISLSLHILS